VSRSSGRAQISPFAALAAVLVLSCALSTYALAFANTPAPEHDRERAAPVLAGALDTLREGGVVRPAHLGDARPNTALSVNLTLRTANRSWHAGPSPPERASGASEAVPVRVAEGTVRSGRLRAEVWT
jgi:hypothetical protein